MVALEDTFQTRIDEGAFADARERRPAAHARRAARRPSDAPPAEPVDFPVVESIAGRRARVRRVSLPTWILPLARVVRLDCASKGVEHLARSRRPGDLRGQPPEPHGRAGDPGGAAGAAGATASRRRWRKEFFKAHFFPEQYGRAAWFTNSLNYYLAALFFNAFPLPQREAGARQTLRYIGEVLDDGFSVLIFPGGPPHRHAATIDRFRPGIGMIASRLDVPVVPVRLDGLDQVLHHTWRMARPGRVAGRVRRAAAPDRRRLRSAGASRSKTRSERFEPVGQLASALVMLTGLATIKLTNDHD